MRNPRDTGWPDHGERTEDREVALRWAWAHLDYVRDGIKDRQLGRAKGRLLGEALESYRRHQSRHVAHRTYAGQRSSLQALLDEFGQGKPLNRIDSREVQAALDRLVDAGFQASTVDFRRRVWRRFFRWAGEHDPTKGTTAPSMARPEEIHAWSLDEWTRVRDYAEAYRGRIPLLAFLDFAVCTGARVSEVLAMRLEDLSPERGTVRIARQLEVGSNRITVLKGKRARTALVLPELWRWRDVTATGLVLGRQVTSKSILTALKPVLDRAGLGGFGRATHDCRRTYIRQWLERGASHTEVQKWVGHSSVRVTEIAYPAFSAEQAAENAMHRLYPNLLRRNA